MSCVNPEVARGGVARSYIEREEGNVLIAVVDIVNYRNGCFSRSVEA